jgi:hypothetical protein
VTQINPESHCTHEGFHSGQGRYCQETGRLRYVVVCDACQAELRELHVLEYHPAYDPRGDAGRDAA